MANTGKPHSSMKESERTKKTTASMREAHIRSTGAEHTASVSQIHATERATVPGNEVTDHPAVKHSVGHYIERSSKTSSSLRRHRG